ncbi:hypothetical protein TWF694_005508 [Orbilia ellipsospora]|uniref:Thioredoxin n=1 Tax=Orbilia ellipsospora TaxID=2528407 RepID=A0AAV9WUE2_9PEZI
MPVKAIESLKEFQDLLNGEQPFIVDFWATWCGPCRVISPVFEKLSDDAANEGIAFYKVDVDTQEEISQEVGIRAMPTFIIFHKGNKVNELVGANPAGLTNLVSEAGKLL